MSLLSEEASLSTRRPERIEDEVILTTSPDILVFSGGYWLRVEAVDVIRARIHANDVPPSIVAEMLRSTGAGHLRDYDEAVLFEDWRERLLRGAPDTQQLPVTVIARVEY